MEVSPPEDQSWSLQALALCQCLWSPPHCGQQGKTRLSTLGVFTVQYIKGIFLEDDFISGLGQYRGQPLKQRDGYVENRKSETLSLSHSTPQKVIYSLAVKPDPV